MFISHFLFVLSFAFPSIFDLVLRNASIQRNNHDSYKHEGEMGLKKAYLATLRVCVRGGRRGKEGGGGGHRKEQGRTKNNA